jgi:formate dehydrogenase major subunit
MMIKLTIDEKSLEVPEGTSVLKAARSAGIEIPTLCEHPHLTPYGGCRLCLVEVEGARTLQPSCTLPVTEGMIVRTNTEKIKTARKFVLTLIFSERNHFCPYCQVSGGDCELQNAAYDEGMTHWPLQPNWQSYPMDASHPFVIMENNRCILCRRCVRACGELVGNFTLGFEERGARSLLVADLGVPLGASSCISCGTCVQVCPTGAMIDRWSAYHGRETQVEKTKTICVGCSVGCGIEVLTRDNNFVRIEGDWTAELNEGVICKTGRFIPAVDERERLTSPMIRNAGSLKVTTWDEAIKMIATKLEPLSGKGGSGIAALASSRLPAEALFTFKQIFQDKLESNIATVLDEGKYTHSASKVANEIGKSFEGSLKDLEDADCVVCLGVDLVKEHEVAGFMIKRNIPRGTNVIVIDPKSNSLNNLAQLVLKPDNEINAELIRGIIATALQMNKGKSSDLAGNSLESAIDKSNLPMDDIKKFIEFIGNAEHVVFVFGKGLTEPALKETLHLAEIFNAKMIGVKGEANGLTAAQYGLDGDIELKGHQAVYVALGDEEPSQQLIKTLEKAPFLVVQASHVSPLTARADVVLPVENWFEQDGHYLNLEGRLQESHRALNPADEIHSNNDALQKLANKMGVKTSNEWKKALKERIPSVTLSI